MTLLNQFLLANQSNSREIKAKGNPSEQATQGLPSQRRSHIYIRSGSKPIHPSVKETINKSYECNMWLTNHTLVSNNGLP